MLFAPIAATAQAAAPHVAGAVLAGTKAVAGMAVAAKASQFAKGQVNNLLDHTDAARRAGREARRTQREERTELRDVNVA
jgi:hypothetical protein